MLECDETHRQANQFLWIIFLPRAFIRKGILEMKGMRERGMIAIQFAMIADLKISLSWIDLFIMIVCDAFTCLFLKNMFTEDRESIYKCWWFTNLTKYFSLEN